MKSSSLKMPRIFDRVDNSNFNRFSTQKYHGSEFMRPPLLFQWSQTHKQDFHFRLQINEVDKSSTGDLMAIGPNRFELKYDTITLTDQLREMNDKIIECRRVDNQWIFHYLCTDRRHPNRSKALQGKIVFDLLFYLVFNYLN